MAGSRKRGVNFSHRFSVVTACSHTMARFVTDAGRPFRTTGSQNFTREISLTSDTPIYFTGKYCLLYIRNGIVHERECDMMNVR